MLLPKIKKIKDRDLSVKEKYYNSLLSIVKAMSECILGIIWFVLLRILGFCRYY